MTVFLLGFLNVFLMTAVFFASVLLTAHYGIRLQDGFNGLVLFAGGLAGGAACTYLLVAAHIIPW